MTRRSPARVAGLLCAVALLAGSPADAAIQEPGGPAIGYWTETNAVVVDEAGGAVRTFPRFDRFSFGGGVLAGQRAGEGSSGRIVGYDVVTGGRLYRIGNATNPVVAATGERVAFLPTYERERYVNSIWMRTARGKVKKVAQFRTGPGRPGIPHGMGGDGGPLEVALDARGRYLAIAFGLEPLRSFDVWIVDSKTGEATRMTRGENSHNPSLSPDGELLAVRVERPESCSDPMYGEILVGKIRVVSRRTGEARDLTGHGCDLFYDTPRWVDDDTLVAVRVTKDPEEALGYDLDIVQIDAASGAITELVTEGNPCCPTASPSLGKIAYGFSDRRGFSVLDLDSGSILDFDEDVYVPHLAGEGRS